MEHQFIEKNDLIDRYVRGTLRLEERSEFEEHFLDCRECLEQLELARSLREGIKICAADPKTVRVKEARPSGSGWFAWLGWRPAGAMAASVLLIASIPSVVMYRSLENARTDLDRANRRADQVLNAPILPPAVYTLSPTRGGLAIRTIKIPEPARWILLAIDVDASAYPDFRAVLRDSAGQAVWTSGSIPATGPDSVGVALPSQVFHRGNYVLTLEGHAANGGYVSAGTFPLHAIPSE